MLSKIVWAVLLSTIATSVVGRKPTFLFQNRPMQRGIVGQYVELPCVVIDVTNDTMELSWRRNSTVITRDSDVVTDDIRFTVRNDRQSNTYMLTISPVREEDSGNFECVVSMALGEGRHHISKVFNLQVIEYSPGLGWRADGRCGEYGYLIGEYGEYVQAGCDALGAYPCCSPYGWCGFTDDFCDCPECVDYSTMESNPCGLGFQSIGNGSTCVYVGKSPANYKTALFTCHQLSASLLMSDSITLFTPENVQELFAGSENTLYWLAPNAEIPLLGHSPSVFLCTKFSRHFSSQYYDGECQDVAYPLCVKPHP